MSPHDHFTGKPVDKASDNLPSPSATKDPKQRWAEALAAPEFTYDWYEHPECWEQPCCCATCRSYATEDGD